MTVIPIQERRFTERRQVDRRHVDMLHLRAEQALAAAALDIAENCPPAAAFDRLCAAVDRYNETTS